MGTLPSRHSSHKGGSYIHSTHPGDERGLADNLFLSNVTACVVKSEEAKQKVLRDITKLMHAHEHSAGCTI